MPESASTVSVDERVASAVVPVPRCSVSVRVAKANDMAFIDSLQKMHTHMVGWFPRKQMESYIEREHVLIAEDDANEPIGYCVAKDQYMKRDDVGIIYQLNVLPLKQRHLIGATLVKATFERAAYGCRLFSCWCAQDIAANWFWESIGFVPLAFRTGSRCKQRVHIFWQRRVCEDDGGCSSGGGSSGGTPYWFPYQTQAGSVRGDRVVLPIPPGTHWRDPMPVVLPQVEASREDDGPKTLPGGAPVRPRPAETRISFARKMAVVRSKSKHLQGQPPGKAAVMTAGGVRYIDRADYEPEEEAEVTGKRARPRKPREKHDPKLIAAARELRDRYLEHFNGDPAALPSEGKYDVSRQIELTTDSTEGVHELRLVGNS